MSAGCQWWFSTFHVSPNKSVGATPSSWHLPRAAIAVVLHGDFTNGWLCHFGLKCSSWTAVNQGTSGRSACCSIGIVEYQSVREANLLASRNLVKIDVCWLKDVGQSISIFAAQSHIMQSWLLLRMILLMMLVICLNGTIMLEQPISSFFEFYPRWRDLVQQIQKHGGRHAVSCPNYQCSTTLLPHSCINQASQTRGVVWCPRRA